MLEMCKKILCIEDDRETAALIAEEIAEHGYDVHVAFDGSEGFSAILKLMPDLVLLDISMPVMSGFELLERLTGLAPQFGRTRFVLVTAMTDRDIELKGRELGRRRLRHQADRFRHARHYGIGGVGAIG
jgi:DNA-binding response OmpR family regulator